MIAVNEHHQTAYGMMPAPNLIAANLIARTSKAKIAIIGRALPLVNNPVNIAEEFAMLDNLSQRPHHHRLRARHRQRVSLDRHQPVLVARALPGGARPDRAGLDQARTVRVRGRALTTIRYVNLWPRPYQTPHPPIWIPSMGSSETIKWAAAPERKYPFLVTFSGRELVARYLNLYREQAEQYGYEASPSQLGWASPVYVADTDERARKEAGPASRRCSTTSSRCRSRCCCRPATCRCRR